MPKFSAGIMLYKFKGDDIEVFLVHPGGPFWAKKDDGSWSVPKGEYAERDDALKAAKREFKEETSYPAPEGDYLDLGEVSYSNKKLRVWAVEGNTEAGQVSSNTFEMEWPPKSGKRQTFNEVDKAQWFNLADAKMRLVKGQVSLIDKLAQRLGHSKAVNVLDNQTKLL